MIGMIAAVMEAAVILWLLLDRRHIGDFKRMGRLLYIWLVICREDRVNLRPLRLGRLCALMGRWGGRDRWMSTGYQLQSFPDCVFCFYRSKQITSEIV